MRPIPVDVAAVLLTAGLVVGCNTHPAAPAPPAPEAARQTVTRINVDHVRVASGKPFDTVSAAFIAQLGTYDAGAAKQVLAAGDAAAARARLAAMAGPSGLMRFETRDHGSLLGLAGRTRKAVQYDVGNPLVALEMTQHAVGAGLYAPIRVLIFEADDGTTCIEYDRPSSVFGQFGNANVDRTAAALDQKFEAIVAAATN